MAGKGFEVEEWDADFLDQLVQAEELALSSTTSASTQHHHAPAFGPAHAYANHISYSPPRELSQRVRDAPTEFGNSHFGLTSTSLLHEQHNDKEEEIERLKTELARVSKKLTLLEEECLEIKKERDKKEEQLKTLSNRSEAKDEELHHKSSKILHHGIGIHDCGNHQAYQKENCSKGLLESRENKSTKGIGIQTDKVGESDNSSSKNDLVVAHHHQIKLLNIWNLFNGQTFGRDLVLKLFSTCEVDFQILFGYFSFPSKTKLDTSFKSDASLMGLPQCADAAKVSHLYFMLTKISNEMVRFEDVLEALIDLCGLNNETIVYRSLRILRAVIKQSFSMKRTFSARDNIVIMGPLSENTLSDKCDDQSCDTENPFYSHTNRKLDQGNLRQEGNLSNARTNLFSPGTFSVSGVDWSSLFEIMCEIASRNVDKHIRLEAVSIMNIIAVSCNAYSEREKLSLWLASELVFRSVLQLLRKEAGFLVRRQAVKLLYQLFNCPKVTAVFCSGYQGAGDAAGAEIDTKMSSTFQEFSLIMEALVDCIACSDNSTNALKLRRSAITLVAFLASLGKPGVAIMLNCRLGDRDSILACIMQSLMSDVDFDALDSAPFDVFRERTLLLREALILLNRVVSHPQYSVPVLQALTSSRDIASLTIDIAKRLSQKRKCLWQDDTITKQIRESEITELARVFKRRVFSFLGDGVS